MSAAVAVRRWAAVLGAMALGGGARAGDAAVPPAAGMAAAKRDYDAVKAATAWSDEGGKLALPTATQPTLDLGREGAPAPSLAPSATNRRGTGKPGAKESRSKNWLVDAMSAPLVDPLADTESTRRDRLGGEERGDEDRSPPSGRSPGDRRLSTTAQRESASRAGVAEAANPLDRFMAAWMTPQDFKLLKSTPTPDAAVGTPFAALAQSLDAPAGAEFTLPSEPPDLRAPRLDSLADPASNPYLAAMEATPATLLTPGDPASPGIAPPPAPSPAASILPAPTAGPTPEPVRSNSAASEFRRAQDDARYFKQLKRF